MSIEAINRVEILESGELLVGLSGAGNSIHQHVYRAAAGVSWDPVLCGFKSTPLKDWSQSKWFGHILEVVQSELGVELCLVKEVSWKGISEEQRQEILSRYAI